MTRRAENKRRFEKQEHNPSGPLFWFRSLLLAAMAPSWVHNCYTAFWVGLAVAPSLPNMTEECRASWDAIPMTSAQEPGEAPFGKSPTELCTAYLLPEMRKGTLAMPHDLASQNLRHPSVFVSTHLADELTVKSQECIAYEVRYPATTIKSGVVVVTRYDPSHTEDCFANIISEILPTNSKSPIEVHVDDYRSSLFGLSALPEASLNEKFPNNPVSVIPWREPVTSKLHDTCLLATFFHMMIKFWSDQYAHKQITEADLDKSFFENLAETLTNFKLEATHSLPDIDRDRIISQWVPRIEASIRQDILQRRSVPGGGQSYPEIFDTLFKSFVELYNYVYQLLQKIAPKLPGDSYQTIEYAQIPFRELADGQLSPVRLRLFLSELFRVTESSPVLVIAVARHTGDFLLPRIVTMTGNAVTFVPIDFSKSKPATAENKPTLSSLMDFFSKHPVSLPTSVPTKIFECPAPADQEHQYLCI